MFMPVLMANSFFMQLYMVLGMEAVRAFTAAMVATTKNEEKKKD